MPAYLVLRQMTLIDGSGQPPREHVILVVSDGRILYVGDEAA